MEEQPFQRMATNILLILLITEQGRIKWNTNILGWKREHI
jgi:hypothetical protein